jgi:hypothetical protein
VNTLNVYEYITSTDAGDRGTKIRKEVDVFVVVKNNFVCTGSSYIIFRDIKATSSNTLPKNNLPCIYVVLIII